MNLFQHFQNLNQYNTWANQQTFLSLEKAAFPQIPTELLEHVFGAELIWISRLKGEKGATFVKMNVEEMKSHILDFGTSLDRLMATWTEATWQNPIETRNLKGEVFFNSRYQILTHLMNHGTYHRAQIATRLRQAGFEPATTDFIRFCRL